jgi:hypothetical protein
MSEHVEQVVYGPEDWRELTGAPLPDFPLNGTSIQCAAIKDNGEQCRARALLGTPFCRAHGGSTITVQEQTRRRLDMVRSALFDTLVEAAGEAVDTYVEIMRNGRRDTDRLAAADRVLRMMGFHDTIVVKHENERDQPSDIDTQLVELFATATRERLARVIDVPAIEIGVEPAATTHEQQHPV